MTFGVRKFLAAALTLTVIGGCSDTAGLGQQTNVLGVPEMFVANSNSSLYRRVTADVGRVTLDRRYPGGNSITDTCTVTHVGAGLIVGAAHCFVGPVRTALVDFGVVEGANRTTRSIDISRTQSVSDEYGIDLDVMFGVLRDGAPGPNPNFPARWPRNGEALYIIHYPDNGVAHVSARSCRVRSVEGPFFSHDCATDVGSSGAVIFALDDNAAVGIHRMGFSGLRQQRGNNEATAIMLLIQASPELQRVFPQLEARAVAASTYGPLTSISLSENRRSQRSAPVPSEPYPASIARRLANSPATKFLGVRPDTETIVNWHSRSQEDCSFKVPAILFRELPQNGSVRTEVITTTFVAPDSPPDGQQKSEFRRCRNRPFEYVQIIYTPDEGFTGTDSFTYDRITGDRHDVRATLRINVNESASTSRFPWDRPSRIVR